MNRVRYTQDQAEALALDCLTWLLRHDELLPVFLGATGSAAGDLRARAQDADFLGSVLDFILQDDAWVLDFTNTAGLPPEAPMQARAALPGGTAMHWT